MRQLLLAIFIVTMGTTTAFAQTASAPTRDSAVQDQKFYFPARFYSDSAALSEAIPKLAEQVLAVYHDSDKRTFFVKSIPLYLASRNYGRTLDFIDSVRKIDGNNSYGIALRSYSLAKIAEQRQRGSFDEAFRKEYSEAFDQLSFRKKVRAAFVDPSWLKNDSTELAASKEKMRENNKDSIALEDGRALCEHFFKYTFDRKIRPIDVRLDRKSISIHLSCHKECQLGWCGSGTTNR